METCAQHESELQEAGRRIMEQEVLIGRLAGALVALLANDAIVCVCPPADLQIGGRGHTADCDTAIARVALLAAGRMS